MHYASVTLNRNTGKAGNYGIITSKKIGETFREISMLKKRVRCSNKVSKVFENLNYIIKDDQGRVLNLSTDRLKELLDNNDGIKVSNLRVNNGSIVSINEHKIVSDDKLRKKMETYLNKAKALSLPIQMLETACGHKCILIKFRAGKHMLLVPDDVSQLVNAADVGYDADRYENGILDIAGELKVIGGSGIVDASRMFAATSFSSIDLSDFNTSNIQYMISMFAYCEQLKSLNLRNFDTHNVVNMSKMFEHSVVDYLDLTSFDTSKVEYMNEMFAFSTTEDINIGSFDTSKVLDMSRMFYGATTCDLDLLSFNVENVSNMECMFAHFTSNNLDLSSFNNLNYNVAYSTELDDVFMMCETKLKCTNTKLVDAFNLRERIEV